MNEKIGFACKWETSDTLLKERITCKTTTVKHASGLSQPDLYKKLEGLVEHNLSAIDTLIKQTGSLHPMLRMCRLTSDILPLKTHAVAAEFWASKEIADVVERGFARAGESARALGVRLSFHPGQFTVLNSVNEGIVLNAIREVEMHTEQAVQMGATGWHSDGWVINIHAGSKAGGLDMLKQNIARLSESARGMLTIENDEFSWGVRSLVEADLPVPIVIDLHHHWISDSIHMDCSNKLADQVIEGWRGARPKLHAALSIRELVPEAEHSALPDLARCIGSGQTRSSLRAHSGDAWHEPLNEYFRTWLPKFDIMFEGKSKQIGAEQIARPLLT